MKKFVCFLTVMAIGCWCHADIPSVDGSNTVGFAEITAQTGANTIITVPFEACMTAGEPGKLADLVSTNGLISSASDPSTADQLVVLTTNDTGLVYYYYWYKTDDGWTAINTSQKMPDGSEQTLTPPAASAFSISRGLGFWIKRPAGSGSSLYVKGQVSEAKQSTEIREGLNLVGYGSVEAFTLNNSGIDWTGAYGAKTTLSDKILVVDADGSFTEYFYFVKPAAWPSTYEVFNNKWITQNYVVASNTIAAGQGFWYQRRGSGSFTFKPNGE